MKKVLLLSAILALTGFSLKAQSINTSKSKVTFKVSNMKANTVDGSFTGMKGTVDFVPADAAKSSFNVCIDANTVETGIEKRDKHLRNEDFFYVEKYPSICFISESVSGSKDQYIAKGKLTTHGVTKSVSIPFTYSNNTLTGKLNLKRLDYGVGKGTGTFMVGNDIDIKIVCVIN